MTFKFLLCVVLMGVCAIPATAHAQLGWSASQVQSQFGGAQRVSLDADHPADTAYKVTGLGATPTTTYLLREGRVAGLVMEWTGGISESEVLAHIRMVSGLPEPITAHKSAKPAKPSKQSAVKKPLLPKVAWHTASHQCAVLPPLGAWQNIAVVQPIGKAPVGIRLTWKDFYDRWGNHIGTSPTRTEPLFAIIPRFMGTYRLNVLKAAIPLIREDATAYAWAEYSNYTNGRGFLTNRVEVLEPELYWRMRFAQFQSEAKRLDGAAPGSRRRHTLDDLRPSDLEVDDDYQRTLCDHLAPNEVLGLLHIWRTNAVVGAIDNERVSLKMIDEYRTLCDPGDLAKELLRGIRLTEPRISIRRAEILDQLGELRWVKELSDVLRDEQRVQILLPAMQRMARRHAKSDQEILRLEDDPTEWDRWYKRVTTEAKK